MDAETEELRGELRRLPLPQLVALARSEGVGIAGKSSSQIIEALLAMAWDDNGELAEPDARRSSQQGAHHRRSSYDQPQHCSPSKQAAAPHSAWPGPPPQHQGLPGQLVATSQHGRPAHDAGGSHGALLQHKPAAKPPPCAFYISSGVAHSVGGGSGSGEARGSSGCSSDEALLRPVSADTGRIRAPSRDQLYGSVEGAPAAAGHAARQQGGSSAGAAQPPPAALPAPSSSSGSDSRRRSRPGPCARPSASPEPSASPAGSVASAWQQHQQVLESKMQQLEQGLRCLNASPQRGVRGRSILHGAGAAAQQRASAAGAEAAATRSPQPAHRRLSCEAAVCDSGPPRHASLAVLGRSPSGDLWPGSPSAASGAASTPPRPPSGGRCGVMPCQKARQAPARSSSTGGGPRASSGGAAAARPRTAPLTPRSAAAAAGGGGSRAPEAAAPRTPQAAGMPPRSPTHVRRSTQQQDVSPCAVRPAVSRSTGGAVLAGDRAGAAAPRQRPQLSLGGAVEAAGVPPATPSAQLLHTPLRVPVRSAAKAAGTAAGSRISGPGSLQAVGTGMPPISPRRASSGQRGAVTPPRQRVAAFGSQPLAAAPAHAAPDTAAASAVAGGLLSPRGQAMGSARRVAATRARTAAAAAAGAAAALQCGARGDASSSAGAVPPVTPLHKPARRLVPPSSELAPDEQDKHLASLVERCLRVATPEARKQVLHGPEPAKAWLREQLVAPWRRAAPAASDGRAGSGGGGRAGSSSACLAAGVCHAALLLYGPGGSGKTELVHALAAEMGASLLYVPAGDSLLQEGQRLLRALMQAARRTAPVVVCFDDAHLSFPAGALRAGSAASRMVVELMVQLQQLADAQEQLEHDAALQQARRAGHHQGSGGASTGGAAAAAPPTATPSKRTPWGFFGAAKSSSKAAQQQGQVEPAAAAPAEPAGPAYARLRGPVVVVLATRHPEALEPSLLELLHTRLLLDLPSADTREELLMSWLAEREAAVGVQDVEALAKHTEGFSCSDLLQLCQQAALEPMQERSGRAVCMRDLKVALRKVGRTVSPTRQAQLRSWA